MTSCTVHLWWRCRRIRAGSRCVRNVSIRRKCEEYAPLFGEDDQLDDEGDAFDEGADVFVTDDDTGADAYDPVDDDADDDEDDPLDDADVDIAETMPMMAMHLLMRRTTLLSR